MPFAFWEQRDNFLFGEKIIYENRNISLKKARFQKIKTINQSNHRVITDVRLIFE